MGIFKKLGLALTPKVDVDKPFVIHPLAHKAHPGPLLSWALGQTIEALHPTEGWVVVDRPQFEPDTQYRAGGNPYATAPIAPMTHKECGEDIPQAAAVCFFEALDAPAPTHAYPKNKLMPAPAPKPQTTTRFVRGDIWEAVNGRSYLVLGNKHDIVPHGRYDASQDPDKYPLILVRYEEGMKQSVTHRDLMGRRELAPNENLVKRTGSINLPFITHDGIILKRKKDQVIVGFDTFETLIVTD